MSKKLFDFAVGNPPYNEDFGPSTEGNKNYAKPIYNVFLDAAYTVSDKTEMIHPARFLFNAGGTPKDWNQKMLNDPHFKVLQYEADSSKVFNGVDIKGGIAITYHDNTVDYGAIGIFTSFPELNEILNKVIKDTGFSTFSAIIENRGLYRFSKKAYNECPKELSGISDSRIGASSFEKMSSLFTAEKPTDEHEYVQFYGLLHAKRCYRWYRTDYFNDVDSFHHYKVMVPAANGSGALGEVLSTPLIGQPLIGQPLIGHTETFMTIGNFETEAEADACLKYVKSKFCRVMLGVLKITQHNSPEKWYYVPLQDFTASSDIDWSKSIPEIDRQLYAKYGLSADEIEFIESHVKEMI